MKKNLVHDIGLRLLKFLNIVIMTVPFGFCWYLYDGVIIGTNSQECPICLAF